MIRFFNTLSGRIEPFRPLREGEVRIYTCGPTVYDYPHIGNYRAYMFEDLLKRFLISVGYRVLHVMNITDIDDKTIKGAREQGVSLSEFTRTYTQAFFEDIRLLRIAPADHYPRATEHILDMAQMVKGLLEKGYAYEREGSYYFDISRFKDYGKLAKIDLKDLKAGVRVDADEYAKDSVYDFALWKAKKEGEPYWETEIGPGRPGWHIECSVMSAKYLGESFDIHCGGVDNIFPHHENEIAQSEAYTGKKFVNYWLHCQHLIRDGEKMSKSKGNIITPRELVENHGADPMALRLLLLSTHYRKMLNFTFDALEQASASLARINNFLFEVANTQLEEGKTQEATHLIDRMTSGFVKGLSDDLNISGALTAVFEMIRKANAALSKGKIRKGDAEGFAAAVRSVDQVLAVATFPENITFTTRPAKGPPGEKQATEVTARIEYGKRSQGLSQKDLEKIRIREKARAEKDYALADSIRKELLAKGILLEDTKHGVRWKIIRK